MLSYTNPKKRYLYIKEKEKEDGVWRERDK
jgi:hypothetical protein